MRELSWLKQIKEKQFTKGLLICGVAHGLSMAFRLQDAGFDVEVYDYRIPLRK